MTRAIRFALSSGAWYELDMMQSYLGIISAHGLESLLLENDDVRRRLGRLAYAQRPVRGVCYWAAVEAPQVAEIQGQLADGDGDRALRMLQTSARFLGPVLPSDVRPRQA